MNSYALFLVTLDSRKAFDVVNHTVMLDKLYEKINRKVQGMPHSQTAANPRHQEEEIKNKNIHSLNKQTNVREAQRPAPSSPSEVIRMLKQTEKRGHRAREDFKTLSAPWCKPQSYTDFSILRMVSSINYRGFKIF